LKTDPKNISYLGSQQRILYTHPSPTPPHECFLINFNRIPNGGNGLGWYEFQLIYGEKVDIEKLSDFRNALLPILDKYKIEDFLVLNERKFVVFRVEVDENTKKEIKKSLKEIVEKSEGVFSDVKVNGWNPEKDARDRIIDTAKKVGLKLEEGEGWMVVGREPLNQLYVMMKDDLEIKIKEFSTFMTKVAGRFTKAYIKEMPRRIHDKWLLSLFVHLLINSISYDQIQEDEIRKCPYV